MMSRNNRTRAMAMTLWRYVGSPLTTIVGAILIAAVIVRGESWAIQQAPLLLTGSSIALSTDAGCVPGESAGEDALPVAILH